MVKNLRFLELRREAYGFAIGSLCFFLGAMPFYADAVGTVGANLTFFIGSIFFTAAGAIQLVLSGRRPPRRGTPRADVLDWWSAAVQSAGTLLFNVSTARALIASLDTPDAVGVGWTSDAWGSVAFLVSSAFALGALRRRDELWDFFARSPGAVWLNTIGSVLFAASAVGDWVIPGTSTLLSAWWTAVGTAGGAACFFAAAVVTRPGVSAPEQNS